MKDGSGNGEPGGGSFTRDFEKQMEGSGKGAFLSVGSLVRGTWR